jgi:hypothetical protein
MKGCFCDIGTETEVAARGARYFFLLDAEFLEDGLFLCVDFGGLDVFFFLPLPLEVLLSDTAALSLGFFVCFFWLEGWLVLFVDYAR